VAPNSKSELLILRGTEAGPVELESYANFLRDLVFLHDRLWILASKEASYKLYYSSNFYTRGRRPVPGPERLQLVSAHVGSPFELRLNLNVGEWLEGAARAFTEILRSVATLPAHVEREELHNRLVRAEVEYVERQLQPRQASTEAVKRQPPVLLDDLRSLPGLQGDEGEGRLALLENDVERISTSDLKITSVEVARKGKDSQDSKEEPPTHD